MPNTQRIDHILSTSRDNEKLNKKVIREYGDLSSSAQIQNLIKEFNQMKFIISAPKVM